MTRFTDIVATVFGGRDETQPSAYGGMVDPRKYGVALPDRFIGERPEVWVFNRDTGKSVLCRIVDVGPWNIDDPYWETWGGRPQAETGTDAWGRETNLAGIDLTPAAAKVIGLDGLGRVDWEFVK